MSWRTPKFAWCDGRDPPDGRDGRFRYIQMDIGVDNLRNAKKKVKRGEKEKAEIVKIGNDLHLNNSQVCKIAGIGMPGNYVFESKTSFGT